MDFNCEQRDGCSFFYVLPFSKNKAMIESTWLSKKMIKKIMISNKSLFK